MSNNVIKLILGLCGLLLVILFVEWELAEPAEQLYSETSVTGEEIQGGHQKLPVIKLSKQPIETYSQMVDSPLFIEGRKPVVGAIEETEIQDFGKIDDLFLVGIYSVEERMVALFNKKGTDEKYLKRSKGDDVSGWMLEEIKADKVILEQGAKKQTLMLRAPKPKSKKPRRAISKKPKKNKPAELKK